ncbi:MAG: glycosyltransferase family 39 protein [Candidatus Omnitrophica bacterium]|nr:glycosyltransferase family 39 protein [Candidatus Omnitrophota bacterium]
MKKDISVILIILVLFTFFLRYNTFDAKSNRTYDESVYATLAYQIGEQGLESYNSIRIYAQDTKRGRQLPDYLKKPLFKHPPLYTILISLSYQMFGRSIYAAFAVSLFFGVLLVALAYFLGSLLFNNKIGVYAALLMSIEPIGWVCSQRVWMETTLAFFIALSVYLFIRATKKYNPYFLISSGICVGLAGLTKYPGLLSLFIIIIYALCFKREFFKNKVFIFSLFIPFLMLLPWLCWNYKVYGVSFIQDISMTHGVFQRLQWRNQKRIVASFVILAFLIAVSVFSKNKRLRISIASVSTLAFLVVLTRFIVNSFSLNYIPSTGWSLGMFAKAPQYFYPGRLIELSPFYLFSFLGLVLLALDREHFQSYFFLCLSSFIILIFFIWWKNYQCRYILPVAIFLILLSAKTQFYIWEKTKAISKIFPRNALRVSYVLLLLFMLYKTLRIDLAFQNSACYF